MTLKVDDSQFDRIKRMRSLLSSLSATAKTEMTALKQNIGSDKDNDVAFHTFYLVGVTAYIEACQESLRLYENKLEKIRSSNSAD